MNREDIIQLMRDAGFVVGVSAEHWGDVPFAKLCHPTPTSSSLYRMLESLVSRVAAAEREVIAQSLDKQADLAPDDIDRQWAQEMAAAVRARGNT